MIEIIDGKKYKKCKENQIRNPITKRCVLKKDKSKMNEDICDNIKVIPQFQSNCWFNSILMATLYSQLSRRVVLRASLNWDKTNNFLMVLKNILFKHYTNNEKTKEYFVKNKTGLILFKMLKTYQEDNKLKQAFKEKIKKSVYKHLGYVNAHIIQFYKYLGVSCVDLTYIKENKLCLINVNEYTQWSKYEIFDDTSCLKKQEETKKQISKFPDVIILNHSELNNNYTQVIHEIHDYYIKLNHKYAKVNNIDNYKIKIGKDIENYEKIISFKGKKYKLDSCLISNYDTDNKLGNHSITGLTCKNKHFVYNGFQNMYTQDNIKCSLIPFDWDLKKNTEFCLNNNNCKLQLLNPKIKQDLCFSFNKGYRTLVYVRMTNDKSDVKNNSPVKSVDVSNVSSIIEEMHDIKTMTKDEIIEALKYFIIINKDIESSNVNELRIYYKIILKYYHNREYKK